MKVLRVVVTGLRSASRARSSVRGRAATLSRGVINSPLYLAEVLGPAEPRPRGPGATTELPGAAPGRREGVPCPRAQAAVPAAVFASSAATRERRSHSRALTGRITGMKR
ncbi:hypothetical protein SSBG_06365 [Streptomyces sp. SPB074]|nr:hypothetical protein SSBG_06365 [Streptomyces sp. SPB074]